MFNVAAQTEKPLSIPIDKHGAFLSALSSKSSTLKKLCDAPQSIKAL
jgi:hypothetical protein